MNEVDNPDWVGIFGDCEGFGVEVILGVCENCRDFRCSLANFKEILEKLWKKIYQTTFL